MVIYQNIEKYVQAAEQHFGERGRERKCLCQEQGESLRQLLS